MQSAHTSVQYGTLRRCQDYEILAIIMLPHPGQWSSQLPLLALSFTNIKLSFFFQLHAHVLWTISHTRRCLRYCFGARVLPRTGNLRVMDCLMLSCVSSYLQSELPSFRWLGSWPFTRTIERVLSAGVRLQLNGHSAATKFLPRGQQFRFIDASVTKCHVPQRAVYANS